jgi:hypothetical protein
LPAAKKKRVVGGVAEAGGSVGDGAAEREGDEGVAAAAAVARSDGAGEAVGAKDAEEGVLRGGGEALKVRKEQAPQCFTDFKACFSTQLTDGLR